MKKMILQGVLYTKQILPVSTFMELNGFLIGSAIKYIWTFKVDTPTAGHPVAIHLKRVEMLFLAQGCRVQ